MKITRAGGLTVHTSGRALVSPADELRARGKLGPYDGVVVESDTAGTGEAVNAETGAVTQPGDPLPVVEQTAGEPLEEASWPGNSSETSPGKPPKTDAPPKGRPKRARTTDSPSRRGRAGSSSASSTDTSGPGTGA